LDLCGCEKKTKLYEFEKIDKILNRDKNMVGELGELPWFSYYVQKNPVWAKYYSTEVHASFSNLWSRLEKTIVDIYNNSGPVNVEHYAVRFFYFDTFTSRIGQ
jgi:hypothetical protein